MGLITGFFGWRTSKNTSKTARNTRATARNTRETAHSTATIATALKQQSESAARDRHNAYVASTSRFNPETGKWESTLVDVDREKRAAYWATIKDGQVPPSPPAS
ncbi:hypothetical protein [Streptacidiphilus sp. PAMC 29251]